VTFDLEHGLEVARRLPPELKLIGLLHDAIEDTDLTFDDLRPIVGTKVAADVLALTRHGDETYDQYIAAIRHWSPEAIAVKIADLEANLARMDPEHESLRPRYERALEILKGKP
jgi:(p)ppGpp synthase/HD superfamily hydrolase